MNQMRELFAPISVHGKARWYVSRSTWWAISTTVAQCCNGTLPLRYPPIKSVASMAPFNPLALQRQSSNKKNLFHTQVWCVHQSCLLHGACHTLERCATAVEKHVVDTSHRKASKRLTNTERSCTSTAQVPWFNPGRSPQIIKGRGEIKLTLGIG